ncbi:hypothetical protein WJX72_009979 [[Myrmecia] bisecta]|uniref:Coenzyme Q-binding protein COQ10 START domain-containing protein n=1 Tax=[Myrmecia] bisecta TaxID=41462 RepID=A0AAW1QS42_9CHLO
MTWDEEVHASRTHAAVVQARREVKLQQRGLEPIPGGNAGTLPLCIVAGALSSLLVWRRQGRQLRRRFHWRGLPFISAWLADQRRKWRQRGRLPPGRAAGQAATCRAQSSAAASTSGRSHLNPDLYHNPLFSSGSSFEAPTAPAKRVKKSKKKAKQRQIHGRPSPVSRLAARQSAELSIRASAAAAPERSPPVTAEPAVRLLSSQKGTYSVAGQMHSMADAADVYVLLSDYAALDRVFSSVEQSNVVHSNGQKQILQLCRWEFLIFSGTFKTLLSVAEDPVAGRLVFSLVNSSFMRDFEGRWQITPLDGGGCSIEHNLTVAPVVAPPETFAGYAQKIFMRQVSRVMEDLQGELARRGHI